MSRDLVERYIDHVNSGDADALGALFAADAVMHRNDAHGTEPVKGRDSIIAMYRAFKAAVPDMRWRLTSPVIEAGGRTVFEAEMTGVHSAPMQTPAGELPPTGNEISVRMAIVETLDADGLIVEERPYFDVSGMGALLGMSG